MPVAEKALHVLQPVFSLVSKNRYISLNLPDHREVILHDQEIVFLTDDADDGNVFYGPHPVFHADDICCYRIIHGTFQS